MHREWNEEWKDDLGLLSSESFTEDGSLDELFDKLFLEEFLDLLSLRLWCHGRDQEENTEGEDEYLGVEMLHLDQ